MPNSDTSSIKDQPQAQSIKLDSINHEIKPELEYKTKSLTTQENESGGFLVPVEKIKKFDNLLSEYSIIRKLSSVISLTSDSLEILTDENTAEAGWVTETEKREETNTPKLKQQKIYAHEMYAKPKISQKLLEDATIDIDNWLIQKVAEKMAALETFAFLNGDGDNKPFGILHHIFDQKIEGQGIDVFLSAQDKVPHRLHKNATWLMSPKAFSYIKKLKDPSTGNCLWQPKLSENHPDTLLGYKINVCEQLQDVSAIFGSFELGYQIVDRLGLSVVRDPYSNKPYVEFYVRKRTGGDVIKKDAFAFINIMEG